MRLLCENEKCNWTGGIGELDSSVGGPDDPARCPRCGGIRFRGVGDAE